MVALSPLPLGVADMIKDFSAGGTPSQVWARHGRTACTERGGFGGGPVPAPESPRGEAPSLLLVPAGDIATRQTLRRGALSSLWPSLADPAALAGLQNQRCHQEAL